MPAPAGALEVGSVYTRLGYFIDDKPADRYEKRNDRMRRETKKDIVQDAKLDVDEKGFQRWDKATDQAEKKQGRFRRAVGSTSSALKVGMATAATVAAAGVVTYAAHAVDAASDVQESITKNRVLFGEHAKEIEELGKTSGRQFGISKRALLEYTGVFGNLARATGIGKKESADLSTRLTTLAADLASFNNTSVDDALEALRSGLVGETEPLRKFGVTLSANSVAAEAMRSGLVKVTKQSYDYRAAVFAADKAQATYTETVKKHGKGSLEARGAALALEKANEGVKKAAKGGKVELDAQTKALATSALIFRQTKNAQGDFARTSQGAANQQRILQARFDDLTVEIGTKLLPIKLALIKVLNRVLDAGQKVTNWAHRHKTAATILATAVGGLFAAFGAYKIIDAVRKSMIALNIAMTANPIGLVIAALAALGVAFVVAYRKSQTFRNIVDGVFSVLKKVVGDWVSFCIRRFDDWLGIVTTVSHAFEWIPGVGSKIRDMRKKVDEARESLRTAADKVDAFGESSDTAAGKAGKLGRALGGLKPPKPIKVKVGLDIFIPGGSSLGKMPGQGDGSGVDPAGELMAGMESGAAALTKREAAKGAFAGLLPTPKGTGLNAFNALAQRFGLSIGSGLRPGSITKSGNLSWHSRGRARDFPGTPGDMLRFAQFMSATYGPKLLELIYTPMGFGIKNGHRVGSFGAAVDADHFDHVHVAMRQGGRREGGPAGPGQGGPIVVYGEGAMPEWWISQEGDRGQNARWAAEALETLTGRRVVLARGGHRNKKKKPPKPKISPKENRGITRSVGRGERGISSFERDIQLLERTYSTKDREYGLSDVDFLVENDDGSASVNEEAVAGRVGELDSLTTIREQIRDKIKAYRTALRKLAAALRRAIKKLAGALKAAKGGARAKERSGYREQLRTYRDRLDEVQATYEDLGYDLEDNRVDLVELGDEKGRVAGTSARAAPAEDPGDPSDPSTDTGTDTPEEPVQLPPSPEQVAAAALAEVRAFQESQASLFRSFGANYMTPAGMAAMLGGGASPTTGAAGLRYFGAEPSAGTTINIENNFAGGPAAPRTWAQEQQFAVEAAMG